jgi:hypothetical protein
MRFWHVRVAILQVAPRRAQNQSWNAAAMRINWLDLLRFSDVFTFCTALEKTFRHREPKRQCGLL